MIDQPRTARLGGILWASFWWLAIGIAVVGVLVAMDREDRRHLDDRIERLQQEQRQLQSDLQRCRSVKQAWQDAYRIDDALKTTYRQLRTAEQVLRRTAVPRRD